MRILLFKTTRDNKFNSVWIYDLFQVHKIYVYKTNLGSDLVTALASLKMHDFPHFAASCCFLWR